MPDFNLGKATEFVYRYPCHIVKIRQNGKFKIFFIRIAPARSGFKAVLRKVINYFSLLQRRAAHDGYIPNKSAHKRIKGNKKKNTRKNAPPRAKRAKQKRQAVLFYDFKPAAVFNCRRMKPLISSRAAGSFYIIAAANNIFYIYFLIIAIIYKPIGKAA